MCPAFEPPSETACYHHEQVQSATAFIFDMDGVILDSMPVHNESWGAYLARFGVELDPESIDAGMHGQHNSQVVRNFFGDSLSAEEIFRHGAEKEKLFREMMRPQLDRYVVAGLKNFLERYRDVPMGLASNAEPANIDFVIDGAGIRSYFSAVLAGSQVAHPKPHPEIYLRCAEMLGVHASDCVIFEDSDTGIQAARAAGARVIGLTTTSPELHGTDLTVRDFLAPELDSWLAQLSPIA